MIIYQLNKKDFQDYYKEYLKEVGYNDFAALSLSLERIKSETPIIEQDSLNKAINKATGQTIEEIKKYTSGIIKLKDEVQEIRKKIQEGKATDEDYNKLIENQKKINDYENDLKETSFDIALPAENGKAI